jgi:hypothetical protein
LDLQCGRLPLHQGRKENGEEEEDDHDRRTDFIETEQGRYFTFSKHQILLEQTKSTSATGCRDPKLITADVL